MNVKVSPVKMEAPVQTMSTLTHVAAHLALLASTVKPTFRIALKGKCVLKVNLS